MLKKCSILRYRRICPKDPACMIFFSGNFFPTHENMWQWILLAYLRIISNQIAI